MQDIKELNIEELKELLGDQGQKEFRAEQIFDWIYSKGVLDFDQMSNLPKSLRDKLAQNFYILGLGLVKVLTAQDQTQKFLFKSHDNNLIEAVCIPAEDRFTACLSTQAGCKFACRFCASGIEGFKRNLTSGEILDQLLYLKNHSLKRKITHIVFMGTGEPLDNYDNVTKAIRIINSKQGFNIGARRITISTCGLIPQMKRLAGEGLQIELSVSLHAADDKNRSSLMPVNKKYPLKELITACREYVAQTGRQITFEYVLMRGFNSDLQNAQNLSKIVQGFDCKINLIPANPVRELRIEPPGKLEILLFRDYLSKHGSDVTLRKPRGRDIDAACGQLRLHYEKK